MNTEVNPEVNPEVTVIEPEGEKTSWFNAIVKTIVYTGALSACAATICVAAGNGAARVEECINKAAKAERLEHSNRVLQHELLLEKEKGVWQKAKENKWR